MTIKKLALAGICLSLAGCGYRGTWDFPYPKPGEPTLEEKARVVVNFLGKNENYLYFYSGRLLVELFKSENDYLEATVTYISKEQEENNELFPGRRVLWADLRPYGSPDAAVVENSANVREINPKTICVMDLQEMTIDAVYETLKGRDHQLKPNMPFYRYFRLCFNELTNF